MSNKKQSRTEVQTPRPHPHDVEMIGGPLDGTVAEPAQGEEQAYPGEILYMPCEGKNKGILHHVFKVRDDNAKKADYIGLRKLDGGRIIL